MKDWWDRLLKTWPILLAVLGSIGAAAILPFRLEAVEKKTTKHEEQIQAQVEQTTALYSWIAQREAEEAHEKELREAAPQGFVWDPASRQYVRGRR